MAKKSPANSKSAKSPVAAADPKPEAPPAESAPVAAVAKVSSKPVDDQPDGNGIGVAEIKKAVSFANSVGGLDKAMSLLQILKVAKDVQ